MTNQVLKYHLLTQGKIKSINIKVGDKVSEGDTILVLENTFQKLKKNVKEELQHSKRI